MERPQRKTRAFMVEARSRLEGNEPVAQAAIVAHFLQMRILMATDACGRQRLVQDGFPAPAREGPGRFHMALRTGNIRMLPLQRENGTGLMVEFQFLEAEAPGGMAGIAAFIELLPVHVGMAVAANPGGRLVNRGLVFAFPGVAAPAGNTGVLAGQGVPRSLVVEGNLFESVHHMA